MHIALIPDGNRRWAKEQGKKIEEGHELGAKKIVDFLKWCYEEESIKEVSVFILSKENVEKRSIKEIRHLAEIVKKYGEEIKEGFKDKYSVRICGDLRNIKRKGLEEHLEKLSEIENITKSMKGKKKLNLLIGYSGRDEIVRAAEKFKHGTEQDFLNALDVKSDVDLVIRTGKETRISNLLLYQIAYAEIFFVNKYWPEFSRDDFNRIIEEFKSKERRFGK